MPLPLTLVHISDLHFGHPCAEREGPPPGGFPPFDGQLGHSHDALIHLTRFMDDERRSGRNVAVVVTGDLTACGKPEEFDLAMDFLRASRVTADDQVIGLDVADVLSRTIPGNHDHWPGTYRIVGRPAGLAHVFPEGTMPARPWKADLGRGRTLVVLAIDSDADVPDVSHTRYLARGSFVSQLQALKQAIVPGEDAPDELRVLLVHHSPMYGRPLDPQLRIDPESQAKLQEFISWARVRVLLTGHIHTLDTARRTYTRSGYAWQVAEIRCGTTTQISRPPRWWKKAGHALRRPLPKNTLVVHTLEQMDDGVRWTPQAYRLFGKDFWKKERAMASLEIRL
ncbi:MAG: metallophosphoesterase [Vicinamibacterales bacterium]